MRPTLEDIAAFTADYLAGEAVAVQVFAAAFDNTFLFAMLANHITGCRKNLPADDGLVMISQCILISLAVIHMPVEL